MSKKLDFYLLNGDSFFDLNESSFMSDGRSFREFVNFFKQRNMRFKESFLSFQNDRALFFIGEDWRESINKDAFSYNGFNLYGEIVSPEYVVDSLKQNMNVKDILLYSSVDLHLIKEGLKHKYDINVFDLTEAENHKKTTHKW